MNLMFFQVFTIILSIIIYWWFLNVFLCDVKIGKQQPQGDYIELHRKRFGRRPDHFERKRKKDAREVHKRSQIAQKVPFCSKLL